MGPRVLPQRPLRGGMAPVRLTTARGSCGAGARGAEGRGGGGHIGPWVLALVGVRGAVLRCRVVLAVVGGVSGNDG